MEDDVVIMGKIVGPHGIKGWLKVHPFTEEIGTLSNYPQWLISKDEKHWVGHKVETVTVKDKTLIVKLAGIDDRNGSDSVNKNMVGILKEELPKLDADTYYWSDLIGLDVQNEAGYYFGSIQTMMETGSNDVMVIKGEREFLIPYLPDVIIKVDLEAKKVLVDWDENY